MRALFGLVALGSAAAGIARFIMWWTARKARRFRDKVFDQMEDWRRQDDLITVESWDEVPEFKSEAEEAAFWQTHQLSDKLLAQLRSLPKDDETRS